MLSLLGSVLGFGTSFLPKVMDFFQDLKDHDTGDEVTMLVFTEFGRRIKDNASGTDRITSLCDLPALNARSSTAAFADTLLAALSGSVALSASGRASVSASTVVSASTPVSPMVSEVGAAS